MPEFLELKEVTNARIIARACCTCRAFREIGSSNAIWKGLFQSISPGNIWHVPSEENRYFQKLFKEYVSRQELQIEDLYSDGMYVLTGYIAGWKSLEPSDLVIDPSFVSTRASDSKTVQAR
jgi:hypothetical protein